MGLEKMLEERELNGDRTCTICGGDFDLDNEGGVEGDFGILPVAFCPTCYACLMDMAEQLGSIYECPHCGKGYDEEPNDEISSS
tara:strand:+ start:310 stop:561 length:252 start_codon:yes stop_codon:yes gene_type:complete